jgi:hypothetical protein
MITNSISKIVQKHLKDTRAEPEIEFPHSWSEEDACYASNQYHMEHAGLSDECFEEKLIADTHTNTQMTFDAILDSSIQDFYQEVAQKAKEWTDKPSDRKKINRALEHVLEMAREYELNSSSKISDRLRKDDSVRIVSKIIDYISNN